MIRTATHPRLRIGPPDQACASFGHINGAVAAAASSCSRCSTSTGSLGGLPDDLNDLFAVAYEEDKTRIHSNSWGTRWHRLAVACIMRSQNSYVHSAHRDLTICFAAGNDEIDENANRIVDAGSSARLAPPRTALPSVLRRASARRARLMAASVPVIFPVDPPLATIHRRTTPRGLPPSAAAA